MRAEHGGGPSGTQGGYPPQGPGGYPPHARPPQGPPPPHPGAPGPPPGYRPQQQPPRPPTGPQAPPAYGRPPAAPPPGYPPQGAPVPPPPAYPPHGRPPAGASAQVPPPPAAPQPPRRSEEPPEEPQDRRLAQAILLSAMIGVILLLVAANIVMLSPGAGQSAAEEAPPATEEEPAQEEPEVEPVVLEGTGDSVEEFDTFSDLGFAAMTHDGAGTFQVWSYAEGADEEERETLKLVDGAYDGAVLINESGPGLARLGIEADGAWTVELQPITEAPVWSDTEVSGSGDEVLLYESDADAPVDVHATHSGESNFIVNAYPFSGDGLFVNEVGPFDGTVPMGEAPEYVEVVADGDWSLTFE